MNMGGVVNRPLGGALHLAHTTATHGHQHGQRIHSLVHPREQICPGLISVLARSMCAWSVGTKAWREMFKEGEAQPFAHVRPREASKAAAASNWISGGVGEGRQTLVIAGTGFGVVLSSSSSSSYSKRVNPCYFFLLLFTLRNHIPCLFACIHTWPAEII